MNDRASTLCLLSFGLLLAALCTRNGSLALLSLPLLAYLGIGILAHPSLANIRLAAERVLGVRQTSDGAAVTVRVTVCNNGAEVIPLRLSDAPQSSMMIVEGSLQRWAALESGEETELTYEFQAARGGFQWETVRAVVSDPLWLFEIELELPAAARTLVAPRLRRYRPFPLRPRSTLHSPGSIPARIGGSGTDFWGVREYHAGDMTSRIEWRRTARHPGRLFTREFEQEEIADIGLILDARHGSDIRCGEDSLFEHALRATASLSEMFLRYGNRVSLLVPGHRHVEIVRSGYGKTQLNRILCVLARARPGSADESLSLDRVPLRLLGSRALIVIVSPLDSFDRPIFSRIRAQGNTGLLVSPDPIAFRRSSFPDDPAGRLAVRLALIERRLELRGIARLGISVIDWQVDQPLSPLVREALSAARARH